MNIVVRLAAAVLLLSLAGLQARAEDEVPPAEQGLTAERQAYLEGIWMGVPTDVSADRLCSKTNPPPAAITLSIEFARSGGTFFANNGGDISVRGPVTDATEKNGLVVFQVGDEVWRLRPDSDRIMSRVRSSASVGGDVDTMVFKRCQPAADRSAIAIDGSDLKFLSADMPGDEAFFVDERLVPKTGDRCAVSETQYLFFALLGPAEFRVSRWNSFALADRLASRKPVKLPPLDPVSDWRVENIWKEGTRYILRLRDFDNPRSLPETIHIDIRDDGISIPQWRRTYVRCKGFQSRS